MSIVYLAQPEQQQKLKRLNGGTLAPPADSQATDGKLIGGQLRRQARRGAAP